MTDRMRMLAVVIGVAALAVAGCEDRAGARSAGGKPRIVATTTMVGDLVAQIAGDRVDLVVMMPAGTDPHTYKPTTKDLGDVARADRIFYNGLHLEGKMVDLFEEKLKGRAVAVSKDIPPARLRPWKEGEGGAHDPHVWFDVTLWMEAARTVKAALGAVDPPNAAHYQQRLDALLARLTELDKYVTEQVRQIPPERRVLITSHDAFNYYGQKYGIEVRGLQGISTEGEASIGSIMEAVQFIVRRKIPAVFVESSVNPKTVQRVQADCKARGVDVKIGGELYSDAMGKPGEHAGYAVETYDGMVRYNTDLIVRSLK